LGENIKNDQKQEQVYVLARARFIGFLHVVRDNLSKEKNVNKYFQRGAVLKTIRLNS